MLQIVTWACHYEHRHAGEEGFPTEASVITAGGYRHGLPVTRPLEEAYQLLQGAESCKLRMQAVGWKTRCGRYRISDIMSKRALQSAMFSRWGSDRCVPCSSDSNE